MSNSEFHINSSNFKNRLKLIYSNWKSGDENDGNFKDIDSILIALGTNDVMYSKFSSLQIWLFGYELTDMIMAFCKDAIYFLASKKKATFLQQIENLKDVLLPPIHVLTRNKIDGDQANFKKIIEEAKRSKKGKCIGTFTKENFTGDFIDTWNQTLKKEHFEFVDLSTEFSRMFAVKDENEISLMTKSCKLTSELYTKYVKEKIMEIVDQDKHVKHIKLADGIEEAIQNTKYISSDDASYLDVCYSPIVQSGSNHALKFSIISDKNEISFDIITCFLGLRYKSYCSNILRTILVNPTLDVQENYEFLLEVEEKLLTTLKEGQRLSDVFNEIALFVQNRKADLVDNLTKSLGFVSGIEFRESCFIIGPKCNEIIKAGMTFDVAFGFSGLKRKNNTNSSSYGLFIGDVVLINQKDQPTTTTVLTSVKKKFKHIAIIFKEQEDNDKEIDDSDVDEDEISDEEKTVRKKRHKDDEEPILTSNTGRALRKTVLENKLRKEATTDDKRRDKQRELFSNLQVEARRRLTQKKDEKSLEKVKKSNVSYKSRSQMPENETDVKELKIFVDKKAETVILPIFGLAVPFHISTIKNISQSIEGSFTYLRINFFHPTSIANLLNPDNAPVNGNNTLDGHQNGVNEENNPESTFNFVKEITYRASNIKGTNSTSAPSSNLNNTFRIIKEVQKKFRTKEAEEKEMQDLVLQDKLILNTPGNVGSANFYNNLNNPNQASSVIRLKDLYIRPNIVQKRITGTLEAHVNGFRYTSIRGDKVDILYNNIKHAFYQPCDHEMIILIHFNLKHGILLGKKKHSDIQFYTEVGEITTDLGKRHYMMHDRDDLQSEQAERELRHKLNTAFKSFCDKVENSPHNKAQGNPKGGPLVEFEAPFRELGFHGVPYRSTVLLQPTSSCLVNLIEWPPFVVTLDELELVHFERVQFHLKNFDMVFVFKEYFKKVVMINAIPVTALDPVKEWLNSCDIYYTEGIQSLNWTKIMKTITDDPDGFFASGGWKFLNFDSDSEGEENEEGEDMDEDGDNSEALVITTDNPGVANGVSKAKKSKRKRERSYDSDEESEYKPSDSEVEESSSDDEENESEANGTEGSSESGSGGSASTGEDEESGKDWDELEKEAAQADRERDINQLEDSRPLKKPKTMHHHNTSKRSDHRTNDHRNKIRR